MVTGDPRNSTDIYALCNLAHISILSPYSRPISLPRSLSRKGFISPKPQTLKPKSTHYLQLQFYIISPKPPPLQAPSSADTTIAGCHVRWPDPYKAASVLRIYHPTNGDVGDFNGAIGIRGFIGVPKVVTNVSTCYFGISSSFGCPEY